MKWQLNIVSRQVAAALRQELVLGKIEGGHISHRRIHLNIKKSMARLVFLLHKYNSDLVEGRSVNVPIPEFIPRYARNVNYVIGEVGRNFLWKNLALKMQWNFFF